jgi:hypothetical protein
MYVAANSAKQPVKICELFLQPEIEIRHFRSIRKASKGCGCVCHNVVVRDGVHDCGDAQTELNKTDSRMKQNIQDVFALTRGDPQPG